MMYLAICDPATITRNGELKQTLDGQMDSLFGKGTWQPMMRFTPVYVIHTNLDSPGKVIELLKPFIQPTLERIYVLPIHMPIAADPGMPEADLSPWIQTHLAQDASQDGH